MEKAEITGLPVLAEHNQIESTFSPNFQTKSPITDDTVTKAKVVKCVKKKSTKASEATNNTVIKATADSEQVKVTDATTGLDKSEVARRIEAMVDEAYSQSLESDPYINGIPDD